MKHLLTDPLFSLVFFALVDAGHKALRAALANNIISSILYGLAALVLLFVFALFLLGYL